MKCLKCGVELKGNARFCQACGSKVERSVQEYISYSDNLNKYETMDKKILKEIYEHLEILKENRKQVSEIELKVLDENKHLKKVLVDNQDTLKDYEQKIEFLKAQLEKVQKMYRETEKDNLNLREQLGQKGEKMIKDDTVRIKLCPHCQTPIEDNQFFCGECGQKIN